MFPPSITEYEDKGIPKSHLTVEEPTWDPSKSEYSERETLMLVQRGQISIPATAARGPAFVSAVISYSMAYEATDAMDNDNLASSLEAQIQISIVLIGTVRTPSKDTIVLAKTWGITQRKHRRLYKPQQREGSGPCSTFCCQDDLEQMIKISVIIT